MTTRDQKSHNDGAFWSLFVNKTLQTMRYWQKFKKIFFNYMWKCIF